MSEARTAADALAEIKERAAVAATPQQMADTVVAVCNSALDVPRLVTLAERMLSLADHFDGVTISHGDGVTEDVGATIRATALHALDGAS